MSRSPRPALALALLALLAAGCRPTRPALSRPTTLAPTPAPDDDVMARHVAQTNGFAFSLARLARTPGQDFVFSPASIHLGLGMLRAGARGDTAAAFDAAAGGLRAAESQAAHGALLRRWRSSRAGFTLDLINALVHRKDREAHPDFARTLRDDFAAALAPMDFAARPEACRAEINAWVSAETRGRIPALLPARSIAASTALVLLNAMYLRAEWLVSFAVAATAPAPFAVRPGVTTQPMTMHGRGQMPFAHVDGVTVLSLPYRDERFAMTLLLPDAADGLDALVASLDAARFAALLRARRPERVSIALPRFTVAPAGAIDLRGPLTRLGLGDIFLRERADFSGIPASGVRDLVAAQVFHQAFVAVTEAGTEAAAATAVTVAEVAAVVEQRSVDVDHPFAFAVHDTANGAVLLWGEVRDPR